MPCHLPTSFVLGFSLHLCSPDPDLSRKAHFTVGLLPWPYTALLPSLSPTLSGNPMSLLSPPNMPLLVLYPISNFVAFCPHLLVVVFFVALLHTSALAWVHVLVFSWLPIASRALRNTDLVTCMWLAVDMRVLSKVSAHPLTM